MRLVVLALSFFALSLTACGTKPRCRTDTCTGCCTQDDQCVAGTSTTQCGAAGNLCDVCVGGQVCAVGRCSTSNVTMTTDAGTEQDAGVTVDAGTMDAGVTTSGPIVAPNEQWTWVDFPNSECGTGTPTGIGVILNNRSTDVIV